MTWLGITRRANASLDEVRTRSKRDGATTKCQPLAPRPRLVQKLEQGGNSRIRRRASALGLKPPRAFRRDAARPDLPLSAVTAAFRTARTAVGQTTGTGGGEWIVYRVTDVTVPPIDHGSDDIKKLKETLHRGQPMSRSRSTSPSWNRILHDDQSGRLRAGGTARTLSIRMKVSRPIREFPHPEERPLPRPKNLFMAGDRRRAPPRPDALILKASDDDLNLSSEKSPLADTFADEAHRL